MLKLGMNSLVLSFGWAAITAFYIGCGPGPSTSTTTAADRRYVDGDFDGDGKTDLSCYQPTRAEWRVLPSSGLSEAILLILGVSNETKLLMGDNDGDKKADYMVYGGAGNTMLVKIKTAPIAPLDEVSIGSSSDKPVLQDYDGDGKTDIGGFSIPLSRWIVEYSSDGTIHTLAWPETVATSIAVPGDIDGDHKADYTVVDTATMTWTTILSTTSEKVSVIFGATGGTPVPADYDGDGKTDPAVYRAAAAQWEIGYTSTGQTATANSVGASGHLAVPGDYDGDGKADIATFELPTGIWTIRQTSTNTTITTQFTGSDYCFPGMMR